MAKRPRDTNQLAKLIVEIATGDTEDVVSASKKHPSKRQVGGIIGGKARAKKLSPAKRKAIAKKAAAARWNKQQLFTS